MVSTTLLLAYLNYTIVMARSLYHYFAFANTIGQRFFNINILTCLTGINKRQAMPMIWCTDHYGINILIFQHLSEIFIAGWCFALSLGDFSNSHI